MNGNLQPDWRTLAEHYRAMADGELIELAEDFGNLTETAQQVLRDELKLRGLGDPATAARAFASGRADGLTSHSVELPDAQSASETPAEYTWKTPLCECATREQAWQIAAVLRQAGIESWAERANVYSPYAGIDQPGIRVQVAADQLEEARAIIARPIPPEIVAQSMEAAPEFEAPVCPKCGAPDPVLEDVDPVNTWKCETCGAEWTDETEGAGEGTEMEPE
jgi:hypothetical protein